MIPKQEIEGAVESISFVSCLLTTVPGGGNLKLRSRCERAYLRLYGAMHIQITSTFKKEDCLGG